MLVIAASRFKIARPECHDLILDGQRATNASQRHLGPFVGPELIGADTVMANIHLVMKTGREAVALPLRRTVCQINDIYVCQWNNIVGRQQKWRVIGYWF